ncbi:MAG: cytochrome b [Rhodoferax sp.]|uniref:cytochrome b n=1 Tax=Rhodoferax sp. TaxID=50421 RepID=UPI00272F09FC|nr:cytochrome b [Rhodoferax sp.]MDP1528441.1 cytochrome b [Rhodoferax sp.]
MAEPRNRYSTVSLILHWLIAALVVTQIGLFIAHELTEGPISREFVSIHKSVGLSILVLTLGRLGWRIANPAIPLPDTMRRWEKLLARGTHVLFYAFLIGMPLVGWAASSAGGRDIQWFGLFAWPLLPIEGGREVAGQLMDMHELAAKALYVLLALHVAGALKHHFIDRDNVLHRMIPWIPRRP